MTEQRFDGEMTHYAQIYDNEGITWALETRGDIREFCKLLNTLDSENKELKKENQQLRELLEDGLEVSQVEIDEELKRENNMSEKRFVWEYSNYDSTGEIYDRSRKECLMTDYLQKYEIEEWCQELNKIVNENEQLKKENHDLMKGLYRLKSYCVNKIPLPNLTEEYIELIIKGEEK